jgi:hypothetical protein
MRFMTYSLPIFDETVPQMACGSTTPHLTHGKNGPASTGDSPKVDEEAAVQRASPWI